MKCSFLIFTMLFTLLFSVFSYSGGVENCSSFWKAGFPNPSIKGKYLCRLFYETSFKSSALEFYRYETGWKNSPDEVSALNNLTQSLNETLIQLSDWDGSLRPLKLILVNTSGAKEGSFAQVPGLHNSSEEPFALIIYQEVLNFKPEIQKQILAHELFHVWQYSNYYNAVKLSVGNWWIESSADFFSNLVFPKSNFEYRSLGLLDLDKSLIEQKVTYSNWLFFQNLSQSYLGVNGVRYLIDILGKNESLFIEDQYAAFGSMSSIGMHFHSFQENFILSQIKDFDGSFIKSSYSPQGNFDVPGTEFTRDFSVKPFAFNGHRAELAPGFRHTWKLNESVSLSNLQASILKKGSKSFDLFLSGYEYSQSTSCKAKQTPVLFLFSAETKTQEPLTTSIHFKSEPESCQCPETLEDLPACWIGKFKLDPISLKAFMAEALKPNQLKELSIDSEVEISRNGDLRMTSNDAFVKVLMEENFGPDPAIIEYGPIVGLSKAKMIYGGNHICFREIDTDLWTHAVIRLGDQVLKQSYPIEVYDEDGISTKAECDISGIEFEKKISRSEGDLKFKLRLIRN